MCALALSRLCINAVHRVYDVRGPFCVRILIVVAKWGTLYTVLPPNPVLADLVKCISHDTIRITLTSILNAIHPHRLDKHNLCEH